MCYLNKKSREHKKEQISEKIKDLIIGKAIKWDEKMPSIRTLSKQIKISPNTVQKAYHHLEHQGYLYSIRGKGYYVAPIGMIQIKLKIENEFKPQFIRLLKIAKYLGLTKEDIIELLGEVEWD